MKRAIIVLLALNLIVGAFVFWPKTDQMPPVPEVVVAMSAEPMDAKVHEVVMYGTAWCGYCAKTRQYFAANGIRYTEHDIETTDQGRRDFEALGGRGIPLVMIDGTKVQGFNPEHMDHLLGR